MRFGVPMSNGEVVDELGGTPGDTWRGDDPDRELYPTDHEELDEGTAMVIEAVDEYLDEQAQSEP